MPKTIHNSRPCSCCSKFIPRKTGKRKFCSPQCKAVATAKRHRLART